MRFVRVASLVAASMLSVGLIAAPAQATPGSGVSGTIISDTTVGGTRYVLREITVQPGGDTGWHYHTGPLYGVMEKGTLTRTFATVKQDCSITETYSRGQTFVEPAGIDNEHTARNLGTKPAVLLVLYVLPAGTTDLSVDVSPAPCTPPTP